MSSTFTMPQKIFVGVKESILPSLSNSEKRCIEGIGKAMRKYIEKDLECIKKTFHW